MNPYGRAAHKIEDWIVEQIALSPEHVRAAAVRLSNDERMRPLWEGSFDGDTFRRVLLEYEISSDRDHWSDKPQRERDLWLAKLEKTVDNLLALMEEAPTTPEDWGFPARDAVLVNVAHRMGLEVPSDMPGLFQKTLELERAADAECWTIADSLRHYREQQRADCRARQALSKPRDAKAGRADFIFRLRAYSSLSTSEIVTIVQVALEDESIDDRLVRRLTAGREDFLENQKMRPKAE